MNRLRVLVVLGIAGIVVGLAVSAQRAAIHRHPKEPIVEGARSQNGWVMDGAFDGTASTPAPKAPGKFVAFLQNLLPFLVDQDDCVNYTPPFIGVRLRVPSAPKQFSITGRTSDGETFQFVDSTTRQWQGKDYRYEAYLPLPAVTTNSQWIDVIVDEEHRQKAIWRVSNLPHLIHHDLTPTRGATITLSQGSTLSGRAYWDSEFQREFYWRDFPRNVDDGRIPVQVNLWIKQNEGNRYWKIGEPTLTEEWDVGTTGDPQSFVNYSTSDSPRYPMELVAFAAIDPSVQHAVQLKGTVDEHVRLTGSVTFRNVLFGRHGRSWYVMPGKAGIVQRSANGILFTLVPLAGAENSKSAVDYSKHALIQFKFRAAVGGGLIRTGSPASKQAPLIEQDVTVPGNTEKSDCTEGIISSDGQEVDWFGVVALKHAPEHAGHIDLSVSFYEDKIVKTLPFDITLPVRKGKPEPDYGEL